MEFEIQASCFWAMVTPGHDTTCGRKLCLFWASPKWLSAHKYMYENLLNEYLPGFGKVKGKDTLQNAP